MLSEAARNRSTYVRMRSIDRPARATCVPGEAATRWLHAEVRAESMDNGRVARYRPEYSWHGHAGPSMIPDVAAAARKLVESESSSQVAAGAVYACEQLTQHLARLVGAGGTRVLLARSATLASARFPWLGGTTQGTAALDAPWGALQLAMEAQNPHIAREAFADLLSTFVRLLERLIGEALVARLLHEIWPELFPNVAKGVM